MKAELRRCPFCGGKPKKRYRKPFGAVFCPHCPKATQIFCDTYEEADGLTAAINAWNMMAGAEYEKY